MLLSVNFIIFFIYCTIIYVNLLIVLLKNTILHHILMQLSFYFLILPFNSCFCYYFALQSTFLMFKCLLSVNFIIFFIYRTVICVNLSIICWKIQFHITHFCNCLFTSLFYHLVAVFVIILPCKVLFLCLNVCYLLTLSFSLFILLLSVLICQLCCWKIQFYITYFCNCLFTSLFYHLIAVLLIL